MKKLIFAAALSTLVATAMLAPTSADAAVVINDGSFAGWILGSYAVGGGSASVTVEASGGNPGARLNVTTVTNSLTQSAFGTAIKPDYSTSATLAGAAFTVTFDALSGGGAFGQGQAVQLLVEQGGAVYALPIGITGVRAAFTPVVLAGTFNAAAFTLVSGSGPATPNLTGGTVTRFGLAAGNTNSATLTQYYDNFVLDITAAMTAATSTAPIPALSPWMIAMLAALLGLVAVKGLRRR